jgi:hypothetical protein
MLASRQWRRHFPTCVIAQFGGTGLNRGILAKVGSTSPALPARGALFRIHGWLGVAAALYIVVMSLSGCVLVFYPELYRALKPHPRIEAGAALLSRAELKNAALRANPSYAVTWIWEHKDLPAEIWMMGSRGQRAHLFHPFTGQDLGRATPFSIQLLNTVKDLHTNLLSGETGQWINGRRRCPRPLESYRRPNLVARFEPLAAALAHPPPHTPKAVELGVS